MPDILGRESRVVSTLEGPIRLSSRFDYEDSHTYGRYVDTGGYQALRTALTKSPQEIVDIVKQATVQGRGGANFPAGNKWGLLPEGVYPRYLVINGDESEPGTYKDRVLMERDPHQLVEGVLIAAYAVGASQAFIYVRGEMALAQERVIAAVHDAYANGLAGQSILGTDFSVDIVVQPGAGAYVVGDETALMESLEGRRGMPRVKPPFYPAVHGLYGKPTVVNNVETISNMPVVINNGAAAFAELGTEASNGTRLFALSGHVKNPSVYELEIGSVTFRDLFYRDDLGGGIRDDNRLKMFIPGGASSPWFFEEQLDLPLDNGPVAKAGSMLGSGAIVVMDHTSCAVRAARRLVRFFARESCGKCTPCREGGTWMERILTRIEQGSGREQDIDMLLDVGDNISPGPFPRASSAERGVETVPWPYRMTTICFLGPSAVSPVASAVHHFRDEFLQHIREQRCPFH